MSNWLDRARKEITAGSGTATANTDDRNLMTVLAVPNLGARTETNSSFGSNGSTNPAIGSETKHVAPLTANEEESLRAWLQFIGEADEEVINELVESCRTDLDTRSHFLSCAANARDTLNADDNRRRCRQCGNLTERGICLAARRGEIVASRTYEPVRELLRRCEGYAPGPADIDRRPGRERWPGLLVKGNHEEDA